MAKKKSSKKMWFGRIRDEEQTEQFIASLPYPEMKTALPHMMKAVEKKAVFLWQPLLACKPSWKRGQQAIGDCVSWGCELAVTCLLAQQAMLGQSEWEAEAATEAIYGGCRVEVHGGPQMGLNEDGAIGSWAADWVRQYGVLLRKDYSKETGNDEHDLSEYSGKKAKQWGYYGNGGKGDKDLLDGIARKYPVKEVTLVSSVEELEAALLHGCPVTVASGVGYGDMKRDSDGICRHEDEWPHQMCFWGIDYINGEPMFHQSNSWGDMPCSGPYPGVEEEAAHLTSWRTTPKDAERQLRERDSFAMSRIEGFQLPPFNFEENILI